MKLNNRMFTSNFLLFQAGDCLRTLPIKIPKTWRLASMLPDPEW